MKFSIITACHRRLSHLRQSLPAMLAQRDSEVIVVDFSCPEGTRHFVAAHYPAARIVDVPGKSEFSNWEARNRGAEAARGEWLVFVDADIVLSPACTAWLAENLVPGSYAKFPPGPALKQHRSRTSAISLNNLQGFVVVERSRFLKLGGYDELLRGWGAGGDVDLQSSLRHARVRKAFLPESLVEHVVEHGDALRFAHTGGSFQNRFVQNLMYRELKRFLLPILGANIPLATRQKIYRAAEKAAQNARGRSDKARADVILSRRPVEMRRRLGHPRAEVQVSLRAMVDNLEVAASPEGPARQD